MAAAPAPTGPLTPLAVPDAFRQQIAEAQRTAYATVKDFSSTHGEKDAWLFRSVAIARTGFEPKPDIELQEIQYLHELQAQRTPEGIATSKYYDAMYGEKLWQPLINELGPDQAKQAARLLNDALLFTNDMSQTVKGSSNRSRPYVADPTINPAVGKPGKNPSFPSGHASAAFAGAEVLAAFFPGRRDEIFNIAQQSAFSRVYAGMHFPTDAIAGAKLGTMAAAFIVSRAQLS
jgi:hypothetical protein